MHVRCRTHLPRHRAGLTGGASVHPHDREVAWNTFASNAVVGAHNSCSACPHSGSEGWKIDFLRAWCRRVIATTVGRACKPDGGSRKLCSNLMSDGPARCIPHSTRCASLRSRERSKESTNVCSECKEEHCIELKSSYREGLCGSGDEAGIRA